MAQCDLSIELDDPNDLGDADRIYAGGGKVAGVVRVRADADVNCKGLEIRSVWKTHGRGNVTSGVVDSVTAFTGSWRAGEQAEYRFELKIGDWPPSYHGHYLNVDHYVEAQAKVPWAFDPKASKAFLMQPTCGPEGVVKLSNAVELKGAAGCVLVGFLVAFFGVIFSVVAAGVIAAVGASPIVLVLIVGVGALLAALLGARWYLPRYLLGEVECQLGSEQLSPGQATSGELLIRPRRNVSTSGITLELSAREQCVSGSGSNRTTHKNVFFERTETLQQATILKAGELNRIPVTIELPPDAPYSIDLDDNDVIWEAVVRVGIPKWPDWTKKLTLNVVPRGASSTAVETATAADSGAAESLPSASASASTGAGVGAGEITFAETAGHVWKLRNDRGQVEDLVQALIGLTFPMEAIVERRLLYSGDEDPHVFEDGYAVWAHYTEPPLPLVLYVPGRLGDEFEQAGRDRWQGKGTIVGWDGQHRRLQLKLESSAAVSGS